MVYYNHYKPPPVSRDVIDFDWVVSDNPKPGHKVIPVTLGDVKYMSETPYDRKLRMLRQVSQTCMACSMCELGRVDAVRDTTIRDPHILSNMNPTKFMIIGQNPGWNELAERMPFVGESGRNFDKELAANGLSRDSFYICNTVRCYTKDNAKPSLKHIERCKPFLVIEFNLLQPLLVITLGAAAFNTICPGVVYNSALKRITKSEAYNVDVFAIYHPSPRNISLPDRSKMFKEQMRMMCSLVKKLKEIHKI